MNADGSGQKLLSSDKDSQPAWSPDSTRIAFTTYRDGDAEIFVIKPDGSGETRLTDNLDYDDFQPSWQP